MSRIVRVITVKRGAVVASNDASTSPEILPIRTSGFQRSLQVVNTSTQAIEVFFAPETTATIGAGLTLEKGDAIAFDPDETYNRQILARSTTTSPGTYEISYILE